MQVTPRGDISIQTIAMPKDANWDGDIFGGWLVAQMDLAGAVCAGNCANGRVATIAIEHMNFLQPVAIGAVVSCYTRLISTGTTSVKVAVEVWVNTGGQPHALVTEGLFTFVAINANGNKQALPVESQHLNLS